MDYSPARHTALYLTATALLSIAPSAWSVIANDDSRPPSLVDTTRIINVLVNDQSPNLDAATTQVCVAGQTQACPELQTALIAPSNGTISVAPDGRSIVYSPNAGFSGSDEFTYAVYVPADAELGLPTTATARVQILIGTQPGREEVGENVRNFENVFGIFCDPSISSQIADESIRAQVQSQCAAFADLTLREQADALVSLTPEQLSATYTATLAAGKDQQRNITLRLNELRNGSTGLSLNNLNFFQDGKQFQGAWLADLAALVGGGASADEPANPYGRLGLFLNGSVTHGDRAGTSLERRFDLSATNLTLGADYRFTDNAVGGVALGYNQSEMDFTAVQDLIDTDSTSLLFYGTWHHELFYLDALAGIAFGSIDTQRGISIGDSLNTVAQGSTDNKQASISLSINHDYQYQALTISPFASIDYTHGVIDSYAEKNGGGFGVVFSDQEIKSQQLTVGARTQYAWAQSWGIVVPHARLEFKKELDTTRDLIAGRFISDPERNYFFIEADQVDGTWGQLAAGVAVILPHGLSGYLEYDRTFGLQYVSLGTFSVGGRWEATF